MSLRMRLEVDKGEFKRGVLGLVVSILEIVKDALRTQALKRMQSKKLSREEYGRLADAIRDLDEAVNSIIQEQGLREVVNSVRAELDRAVDQVAQTFLSGVSSEVIREVRKNHHRRG